MGFLSRVVSDRKATQLTYDQIASLIDAGSEGFRYVAGVPVNHMTALQVSTVLACVKVLADGCATPGLEVYRYKPDRTRERAENIPEYRLLARRPNEWQTSFEWRRMMTVHAALAGAGLSIKVRGDNRRIRELIPIPPGRWDVQQVARYELRYRVWDNFGMVGEFTPDDVFILHGLQWDWVKSLDAVFLARSAIGLGMAAERSQASMHENGLRSTGVYSVDGNLTPEQHERLSGWIKARSGPDKAGTPLIIDRSAKWTSMAISGVDAQHLETRRFQVEEICRGYGVFPIMVGHSDKSSTFASTEAFFGAHVKHTLAPWHRAWTQRIDEMLLDGSGPLFAEFDVRYLMSGSMKDRAMWARTMAEMGIYTRNELRDEEGKDPLPGLDDPLTPLNMNAGKGTKAMQKTRPQIEKRDAGSAREVRSCVLEIRAVSDDGTIEGYGSVFGVRDDYDDVIAAGAFVDSLKAHKAAGTMPAMLWQHDADEPIGVWSEMTEDAKGLRVKGQLALETVRGKEAHALLKLGALNGLSIGFVSKQWAYDRESEVRTLTEIDLWEVSLVTFPANSKARVTNVKASADEITTPKDAERILREAGFSKADATGLVSRVMRMGEERREAAQSTALAMKAAQRLLNSLTT